MSGNQPDDHGRDEDGESTSRRLVHRLHPFLGGDWCKLHDRALSQCFKCDPSKYTKYEAMYVAKFGKKPERPGQEEFTK